jgi:hypothetical protein
MKRSKPAEAQISLSNCSRKTACQPAKSHLSFAQHGLQNEFVFKPLLDSDEAARLLRVHPKTLQRMARNHQIQGIQVGKA